MKATMIQRTAWLTTCALLAFVTQAYAGMILAGVGGNTTGSFDFILPNTTAVLDDGSGGPVEIFIDLNAGQWTKSATVQLVDGTLNTNETFTLIERIRLVSPPTGIELLPLTDWHETILSGDDGDSFQWVSGTFSFAGGAPVDGLTVQVMGQQIWFEFDPILPTSQVDLVIRKELKYIGSSFTGTTAFAFEIEEFPTVPEPTILALLALGVIPLIRRSHAR